MGIELVIEYLKHDLDAKHVEALRRFDKIDQEIAELNRDRWRVRGGLVVLTFVVSLAVKFLF